MTPFFPFSLQMAEFWILWEKWLLLRHDRVLGCATPWNPFKMAKSNHFLLKIAILGIFAVWSQVRPSLGVQNISTNSFTYKLIKAFLKWQKHKKDCHFHSKRGLVHIAKLSSSWQVQYQSNWDLRLVLISVWHTPTHPDKYIWATSRLPTKLKFGMEALFKQIRSTS